MKLLPEITILIVTLNNQRSLEKCLAAIASQDYPKENIEYLNIDGGSTDQTKQIFKKYNFKVVDSPVGKNAEAQRGVGVKLAKNNLIVSLDADNYLPHKNWLKQMVQPFIDDPKVVHAGTLHYHYDKNDAIFNRYNALFGCIDPIVFYVGRPDRKPQYVREKTPYSIVKYTPDTLSTVGCNGVVYRRDLLLKHAQSDPEHFLHIDVFADLVVKGFDRFAIVNTDVIHDTAISLSFLMKKRIAFLLSYYLKSQIKRRYLIFDPSKDMIKLVLYVVCTVTMVKPFYDSVRGFVYKHDIAWFLHPIVCWAYLYAYAVATIKKYL